MSGSSDPSAHMERLMSAMGQSMPANKRILEINADHPVFTKMLSLPPERQSDWAKVLYSQALLNEGSALDNHKNSQADFKYGASS